MLEMPILHAKWFYNVSIMPPGKRDYNASHNASITHPCLLAIAKSLAENLCQKNVDRIFAVFLFGVSSILFSMSKCMCGGCSSVLYSRSYAEDVTSVTSCASQGPHSFNSRSYAEDVTSVTSGASQGPHSFFVCLCRARLALSRICPVPYHQEKEYNV